MRRRKKHIWKEVCRSQMGKPVSISYYCWTCTWLPSSDGLFYWTPYLLPWRLRWRVWHTSKWNPYWMKHVPAATAAAAAVTALRLRNWLAGSPLMSALFTHRYMCVCNRYGRHMSLCDSRRVMVVNRALPCWHCFRGCLVCSFVWMRQRFQGALSSHCCAKLI